MTQRCKVEVIESNSVGWQTRFIARQEDQKLEHSVDRYLIPSRSTNITGSDGAMLRLTNLIKLGLNAYGQRIIIAGTNKGCMGLSR